MEHLTLDLDPNITLAEAVVLTRLARAESARLAGILHQHMMDFEALHAELSGELSNARTWQAQLEQRTRDLGIAAWVALQAEGDPALSKLSKTVYPGVQILERVKLVYDTQDALAWAQDGNRLAVQPECLNVEAFERLARQFPEHVSFVRQIVTYQVNLAKNL